MAMLCRAMQAVHPGDGLGPLPQRAGHGAHARALDRRADNEDITYLCAGINHQAWYLSLPVEGRGRLSADPRGDAKRPEIYNEEQVRNEMFLHLDYYVTEIERPQLRVQRVVPQAART